MYAQPYVGASLTEFNVSSHVFAASLGAGLSRRYTRRTHVLKA